MSRSLLPARDPYLHAAVLGWRAWAEGLSRQRVAFAAGLLLALAVGVLATQAWAHHANALRELFAPLAPSLLGLIAVSGGLACLRRRRRLRAAAARSWLAALPVAQRIRERHHLVRAAWPVLAMQLATSLVVVVASGRTLLAGLALAGIGIADALGLWRGRRDLPPRERALRHSASIRAVEPGLRVLARWPFRLALADAAPKTQAQVLAVLLLSLPMGTTAVTGLLVILGWAGLTFVFALARGACTAIPQAAAWLRATPLPQRRFVRAIGARVLAMIMLAAAAAGLFTAVLARDAAVGAFVAIVAAAAAALAIGTALRHRFDAQQRRIGFVTGTLVLMLAGLVAWWALLAMLVVLGGMQWLHAK